VVGLDLLDELGVPLGGLEVLQTSARAAFGAAREQPAGDGFAQPSPERAPFRYGLERAGRVPRPMMVPQESSLIRDIEDGAEVLVEQQATAGRCERAEGEGVLRPEALRVARARNHIGSIVDLRRDA